MHDNPLALNIEQDPVISRAQPLIHIEIRQPFDIAVQPMLKPGDLCHDLPCVSFRNAARVINGELGMDDVHDHQAESNQDPRRPQSWHGYRPATLSLLLLAALCA
jgi:hypothetical protein